MTLRKDDAVGVLDELEREFTSLREDERREQERELTEAGADGGHVVAHQRQAKIHDERAGAFTEAKGVVRAMRQQLTTEMQA
jgi:hypothetical protein